MRTVPFSLTDIDVSIIKELLKDGRKSFREISRSTGISTPTVKARFDRLVNVGFIKSISPVFDFDKIDLNTVNPEIQLECDFCKGPISGKTHVLKFADIERFFCCFNCRTSYNEKYSGRIEAIKKRFKEGSK